MHIYASTRGNGVPMVMIGEFIAIYKDTNIHIYICIYMYERMERIDVSLSTGDLLLPTP
jgi:hypothetical protein